MTVDGGFYLTKCLHLTELSFPVDDGGVGPFPGHSFVSCKGRRLDLVRNRFLCNVLHDVHVEGSLREDKVKGIIGYFESFGESSDGRTDSIGEFNVFFDNLFIAFGQNILVIAVDLLVEDVDLVLLFLRKGHILDILEDCYLLLPSNEALLQFREEFPEEGLNGLSLQVLHHLLFLPF